MAKASTAANRGGHGAAPSRPPASADVALIEQAVRTLFRQSRSPRFHHDTERRAGIAVDRASYGVLYRLAEVAPARLSDLAHHLGVDVSTVSRQVAALEQRGLVTREADPDDRRAVRLALTADGAGVLARMRDAWHERLAEAVGRWSDAEIATFAGMLDRFVAGLGGDGDDA